MIQEVLISTSTFGLTDASPICALETAGYRVQTNPFGRRLTRDEVIDLLSDRRIVGLLAGLEPLDRGVLESSCLRVVSRVGSGMANVDLRAAQDLGIAVCNTPDGPTSAVAELTIGALLSLLREIPALSGDLHAGRWFKRTGGEILGRTVLIVGYGRIGRKVSQLLHAFGATVLVFDPFLSPSDVPHPLVSLAEGYSQADVISFHNSGEECLLRTEDVPILKRGTYILNASRGAVVSEQALIGGIDTGIIAGAWLDVFPNEPYSGPLSGHPKVLLTPHVGSYTGECRVSMEGEAVQNLLDALAEPV